RAQADTELRFKIPGNTVDRAAAVGDGEFADAHIFDERRRGRFGSPVGDSTQARYFIIRGCDGGEILTNFRFCLLIDGTVLDPDIEHQREGSLARDVKPAAKILRGGVKRAGMFHLNRLELRRAAQRLEEAFPGLEDGVTARILNVSRPFQLKIAA